MEQTDFEALSIEEVMEKIGSGELTSAAALELEKQGKNRKTLVAQLEKMLELKAQENPEGQQPPAPPAPPAPPEEQPPQPPETAKVVFVRNTKHNRTLYQAGQKTEVSKKDFEILRAAKVIRPVEE